MSVLGYFPLHQAMRRTIPGPVNPLDKSTVFSIFPKEIKEVKHTLIPGRWEIPLGTVENPASVTIGPSSWWKDVGDDQPLIEIPVSSIMIADSIVKDYCNGYLGCDMAESMPGLFFVPGVITVKRLREEHPQLLERAKQKQTNFYRSLIRIADAYWSRSNGNPLAISDDMRLAARELQIQGRDWMADFQNIHDNIGRCIACGQIRNLEFPVCPHCKAVVDKEKAKTLGITFAQ